MLYKKGLSLFLLCCATISGPTGASGRLAGADANLSNSVPILRAHLFLPAPFSLARVFINAFTILPTGTGWAGYPSSNSGATGFSLGFWVTCIDVLKNSGW